MIAQFDQVEVYGPTSLGPNNWLQRTVLRAAAEPER